jgi:hypothetical protein
MGPLTGEALRGVMGGATGSGLVCANPFHRLLAGLPVGFAFGAGVSLFWSTSKPSLVTPFLRKSSMTFMTDS